MTGRIDVHSHLLPGVDDGCETIEDSMACARSLVAAGYTHSFCTPHIWPPHNLPTAGTIPQWTLGLQSVFDREKILLKLMAGGEINMRPEIREWPEDRIVTYGMAGKFVLFDIWADQLPDFFEPNVRWLQDRGLATILAHPERMRAVQDNPDLADDFEKMGLLLQGNLQCLADQPDAMTRRVGERYLRDGRYFMLGTDLHNPQTLPHRLAGLQNAIRWMGDAFVDQLTKVNPAKLLDGFEV